MLGFGAISEFPISSIGLLDFADIALEDVTDFDYWIIGYRSTDWELSERSTQWYINNAGDTWIQTESDNLTWIIRNGGGGVFSIGD